MQPPPPPVLGDLSPTPRSTVVRGRGRATTDRAALYDVLDSALVCHLGVDVGHPLVVPTAFGWDPAGPDRDGTLYLHGSVASRTVTAAQGATICVTLTVVDALVAARSAFHHSMNYRSAVILGVGRLVEDPDEKAHALDLVVDHMVPGRAATLRASTRKELSATSVVAVSLHEASVKVRSGGPVDDPADVEPGTWAGHVPVRQVLDPAVGDESTSMRPPPDIAELGSGRPWRGGGPVPVPAR
ncbi:pyridoxamine 5'-phosphate oxidase family protein [Nocardioides sp.]|uniref:pyridoxamine 5'-phosphate oxidase family protein n=1 Tax=Nocardioides sp. TaxID=35761 RepID=UPI0027332E8D|nr:pyridoxamine 5'-phosphate oxidase family protein [Nocardioides sp.]MDP3891480.1 pyridoxamine 5'-phosphate oxidase family protein [Nocardioides sp.]